MGGGGAGNGGGSGGGGGNGGYDNGGGSSNGSGGSGGSSSIGFNWKEAVSRSVWLTGIGILEPSDTYTATPPPALACD